MGNLLYFELRRNPDACCRPNLHGIPTRGGDHISCDIDNWSRDWTSGSVYIFVGGPNSHFSFLIAATLGIGKKRECHTRRGLRVGGLYLTVPIDPVSG
jgi:hypothetical protein